MLTKEDFVGTNGREVLIRGVIDDVNPDNVWKIVRVSIEHTVRSVQYSSVHSILPKRIMVGDTVYFNAVPGVVRYIQGDTAVVDWGEGIGLNIEKICEL
jgi:hypothetical protein